MCDDLFESQLEISFAQLPDFMIISAMKSGTADLYGKVQPHLDIFRTHIIEPGLIMDAPPILQQTGYITTKQRLYMLALRGYIRTFDRRRLRNDVGPRVLLGTEGRCLGTGA